MTNPVTSGLVLECLAKDITASDNDQITQWSDTSGNSNHLVNPVVGAYGTYKTNVSPNGAPGVRFNDNNSALYRTGIVNIQAGTSIYCGNGGSDASGNNYFGGARTGSGVDDRWYLFVEEAANELVATVGSTSSTAITDDKSTKVRALRANGNSKAVFVDGTSADTFSDSNTNTSLHLGVGSYVTGTPSITSNTHLEGDLFAVLHYNRSLTDQEIADITTWLEGEYIDSSVAFSGTVPDQNGTRNSAITSLDLSTYFTGDGTPFTYAVTAGTLPTGLSLNTSTGVISGTPTGHGPWLNVQVTATDKHSNTAVTNAFGFKIVPDAQVTLPTQIGTTNNPNSNSLTSAQITSRVISSNRWQITTYWDSAEKLVIAVRQLPSGYWYIATFDGTRGQPNIDMGDIDATWDGHNASVCEIDSDGYIHVSYGHHVHALNYRRSAQPINTWMGELTSGLSMLGTNESEVTYPQFFRSNTGALLFTFRDGGSGNGDQYLYEYTVSTETWAAGPGLASAGKWIDGKTSSENAYLSGRPKFESDGTMWVVFHWRATTAATSADDISAAQWNGTAWRQSDGTTAQTVPITHANCDVVLETTGLSYYPQGSHDFDIDPSDSRLVVVYERVNESTSVRQLYTHAKNASGTWSGATLSSYTSTSRPGAGKVIYDDVGDRFHILVGDGPMDAALGGVQHYYTDPASQTFSNVEEFEATDQGQCSPAYDRDALLTDNDLYYALNPRLAGTASYTVELISDWFDSEISADFIAAATALYEPTLDSSAGNIQPDLIASQTTLYEPSLEPGAATIAGEFIASSEIVYQPSLSSALTIQAGFVASGTTLYDPSLSGGPATITPDAISSATALYEPTLVPGDVSIAGEFISSATSLYVPTLESVIAVLPDFIGATTTIYAPTLTPGAVTASPDAIASTTVVYEPGLSIPSLQAITPTFVSSTTELYAPVLTGTGWRTVAKATTDWSDVTEASTNWTEI